MFTCCLIVLLVIDIQITPSQKVPKQQELRILLRPRWIKDPIEELFWGLIWLRTLLKDSSKASFHQEPYWRILLRHRLIKDLKSIKKAVSLSHRSKKVSKKQWFYSICPNRYQKSIGFATSVNKYKESMGFIDRTPKSLKKHWFYRSGNRNCWKNSGFTNKEAETSENRWFYKPGQPGHNRATDSRSEIPILGCRVRVWKKQWCCRSGNRNCWKNIGFTSKESEKTWKTCGFTLLRQ